MNWHNIVTVYLKELKDSLRDRRTLLSTIIIPTLVMPLLTFGVGKVASVVINRARGETPSIVILGGEDSPGVVAQLKASKKFRVVASTADWIWPFSTPSSTTASGSESPRPGAAGFT